MELRRLREGTEEFVIWGRISNAMRRREINLLRRDFHPSSSSKLSGAEKRIMSSFFGWNVIKGLKCKG